MKAKEIIGVLGLLPHPEGGYYKEIYRSGELIKKTSLPERYNNDRSISTFIYYMLAGEDFSAFHRLKSDEIWHFYSGSRIILHLLNEKKGYSKIVLGNNLTSGEIPQFVIENGIYFAAEVSDKSSYSLIGCTVAPGFDFEDFEFADESSLTRSFPWQSKLIKKFCRKR